MAKFFNSITGKYEDDGQAFDQNAFLSQITGLNFQPPTPSTSQPKKMNPIVENYLRGKVGSASKETSWSPLSNPSFDEVKEKVESAFNNSKRADSINDVMDELVMSGNPFEYADIDRDKAEKEYKDKTENLGGLEFISSIGDAIAGRDPNQSIKAFQSIKDSHKADTVGAFDEKQKALENQFQRKNEVFDRTLGLEKLARERDPNSAESRAAQALAKRMLPDIKGLDRLTATQFKDLFPVAAKALDLQYQEQQMRFNQQMQTQALADKAQERRQNELKKNSPEERQKNLSGTDKIRLDNAYMALKALDEMGTALDNGQNTFSIIGDNDYTAAERRATEAYGRMQSGGAINKDEEKRFSATLPGAKDTKELQRKKIITQKNEMISRLKTLGFTPQDLGYQPRTFNYGESSLQPGTIEDGHRFKGGDPSDPKNWEVVK